MNKKLSLVLLGALLVTQVQAKGLYIKDKAVQKSVYYTGTTGAAKLAPVKSREWIQRYQGDMADLAIRDYGFVIEHDELNSLIYGIANRLLEHWPGTVPPVALFVQGDGSPLLYGAATTYSKEIFIRYGVLLHASSEDELAAVIAHELAHVLLEHGKALDYKKSMNSMLALAEDASQLYATADALRMDSETRKISLDPSIEKNLKRTAEQKVVADQLYSSVHATIYSRGNEQDADKLALDLLIAAGYAPLGLKTSLERMAASHDLSTEVSSFFETSSKQFLLDSTAAIQQYTDENGIQSDQLKDFMSQSKESLKDSVVAFGKNALVKFTAKSHPVPEKRVQKMTNYLYDEYPRKVRSRKPDEMSADAFRAGAIGKLIADYSEANQAIELVGIGDLPAAQEQLSAALTVATNAEPYPAYAAFMVGRATNDVAGALKPVKSVNPDGLIPVFAGVEIADVLARSGEMTRLDNLVTRHESVYGPINDYLPAKISLAKAADDAARVQQLALECYGAARADSPLANRCAEVSGVERPEKAAGNAAGNPLSGVTNMFKPK